MISLLAIAVNSVPAMFTLKERNSIHLTHKAADTALLPLSTAPRLFAAIRQKNTGRVLEILAMAPSAALATERYGCTPLQYACFNCPSVEIVRALIAVAPTLAMSRDKRTDTPLLYAASSYASLEVLQTLLAAAPEAARYPDICGMLPLHYGCMAPPDSDAILTLLAAFPEAAAVTTVDGWTPLHYACMRSTQSLEVIDALVKAAPATVGMRTRSVGAYTPLELARRWRLPGEIIRALEDAHTIPC